MDLERIYRTVTQAYSGARAKRYVSELWPFNRLITNPAYEKGVRHCADLMRRLGFDDVETHSFPIDGKRLYGNWVSPRHWTVWRGFLELKLRGRWTRVADHSKIPTSLFVYCAPTRGLVETVLVPLSAADLGGKLVFCDPTPDNRLAVARAGARGMATDFAPNWPGIREEKDFRDGHRWDNATYFEDRNNLVGFSLSRNQGAEIRETLQRNGKIPCRFRVDGRLGAGPLLCATGCIRGSTRPDEEVVTVAHLYEAGANDNASGVGGALEALNAIRRLVRQKKLPPPARTLRVIFTFEIVGYMAYFEKMRGSLRHYVAGVNPDMIGEDLDKCKSTLHLYRSPDSNATFADPLLFNFVKRSSKKGARFVFKHFIINDNSVADPAIGIPCPALIYLRDRFYHSNEDSIDKVSPETLKRVGGAMAAYLYAAASLNRALAPAVAKICRDYSMERIRTEEKTGLTPEKLRYLTAVESERIISVERATGADLKAEREALLALKQKIRTLKPESENHPSALVKKSKKLIPVRKVIGPMTLEHIPFEKRRALKFQPTWSTKLNLPLFWVNGRRSVWDVFRKANHESGPYDLKDFLAYFEFLKGQGLIGLFRTPPR